MPHYVVSSCSAPRCCATQLNDFCCSTGNLADMAYHKARHRPEGMLMRYATQQRIVAALSILALLVLMGVAVVTAWGCSPRPIGAGAADAAGKVLSNSDPSTAAMWPLMAVAAPCILTGVLFMVCTRSSRGWRGVAVGAALCVGSYVVIKWGGWLFLPAMVTAGIAAAISLVWATIHLLQFWKWRNGKCSQTHLLDSQTFSATSGSLPRAWGESSS